MTPPGAQEFTAPGGRPIVLLPVRLETRYTDDRMGLRVRVFPDDVHVDRLDRGMDEGEQAAAVAYWRRVWAGQPDDAAYAELLRAVRPDRAAWVATALTPTNLAQRSATEQPVFPAVALGRMYPAPVARGLPDRFVGALYAGAELAGVGMGGPVPPTLVMGTAPRGRLVNAESGLTVGEGAEWLVDYAAAERVGMAFTVPMGGGSAAPLRLLVYGVRGGDGRAELEALLAAHRVTSGLEFLAPGTPTNNTERDRSAWRRRTQPGPPPSGAGPHEAPDADGPLLASALGIDGATLAGAPGAGERGQPLARAAHTALWPASWGGFLDAVVEITPSGPSIGDRAREDLRATFEDVVRGRGPLPALRIGNQPYGVLPVVETGGPDELDGAMPGLEGVLARARVALGEADPPTALTNLLKVLGTAPTMLGLRMRAGLPNLDDLIVAMTIYDPLGDDLPRYPEEIGRRDALAAEYGLNFGRLGYVSFGSVTRPLLLPLVSDGDADGGGGDAGFAAALVDGRDRAISSVLQALLEMGRDAEHRAGRFATGDSAPPSIGGLDPDLQTDVAAVLAGSTDQRLLRSVADRLAARFGFAGLGTLYQYQPFAALRTSLLQVATDRASDSLRAAALQAWCRARHHQLRFDEAMLELVAAPIERRRVVVAEALDCASHRLDAWLTALATTRLWQLRGRAPTGLTLGAYGWVEELPGPGVPRPPAGGYVHAPSLAQAATAGVLRSGNLAHPGGSAFSIDLSSDRVRTGLHLLDGVRQGQPLGAIVGYRIERALQERGLGRFALSLRNAAPLAAGELTGGGALDGVTRSGVLDGVRLLAMPRGEVRARLAEPPADNPYLTGRWAASNDELDAVGTVLDEAAAAYDAAADLMLAESVHQLVSGRTARAAATLDAAGSGDVPPPEPEFARTPTLGVPVTHRDVLLLTDAGPDAAADGWALGRPRAIAEPRLEGWARAMLGPATTIEVAAGITLDRAGLCALDLVYASDLSALLYAQMPAIGDLAPPVRRAAELGRSLRRLLAASRPLEPGDLVASGAQPTHATDAADLERRARGALDALRAAADATAHGIGGGSQAPALAAFGIDPTDGAAALAAARHRIDTAAALQTDWPAVAGAVFGEDFRLLPLLTVPGGAADPFAERLGRVHPRRSEISQLLRDAATVRAGVARHAETLLLAEALGTPPPLRVAQFGGAPAGRPRSEESPHWVALPFDDDRSPPAQPATSVIVEGPGELTAGVPVAGLLVDEWVEVVPRQQHLTSGVAVHADAPGARPPQAILVAVPAGDGDWTADAVATTLSQTLDLAKLRVTTLEFSTSLGWVLPALIFPTFSLNGEQVLDFKRIAATPRDVPVPFVNDWGG